MTDEIIDELDRMERMNIDAARGLRDDTQLERERYAEPNKNGTIVTVLLAGDEGIVVVADRFEQPDIAWASHMVDCKIIDDLYNDGVLVDQ